MDYRIRMIPGPINVPPASSAPLTEAEQERVGNLLSTVSTRTLLHSLSRLCQENADTKLIISALLDRLPPEEYPQPD